MASIDRLDAEILLALCDNPRAGTSELAGRLGVARNTVQARFRRLAESGLLRGFGVDLDLELLGLPVVAFTHLQLSQGSLDEVCAALGRMTHVLEVWTTTGTSDLTARLAARSHAELQERVQQILAIPGVVRSTTEIVLGSPVRYRVEPLVAELVGVRPAAARGARRDGR